jgi:5-methylcytosine-specific restriction protein A
MPPRTPKACRVQGCRHTTQHKHGYCDEHVDKADRKAWANSSKGKGGRPWRRKRDLVKAAADGLCAKCRSKGIVSAGSVCDHIIPEAEGGSSDMSNLQWLCVDCHDLKTAQESKRGAARKRTRGGAG